MAYRENLLVNYLADNPVWRELIQIFEEAWGDQADDLTQQLSEIRDLHRLEADGKAKVAAGQMLDMGDLSLFDRQTMVRICTMLGFGYPNLNDRLFNTEDYLRIAQNIADYYKEQGTDAFIRFFGYCLASRFELKPTWTEDYLEFYPEGDPNIGTPIWEGGTWYPTSHVQFFVELEQANRVNPDDFRDFFYYIAPINLVLLATIFRTRVEASLYIAMAGRLRVIDTGITATYDKLRVAMNSRMRVVQVGWVEKDEAVIIGDSLLALEDGRILATEDGTPIAT